MSFAIKVEDLGKEYHLGVRRPQGQLLVDQLAAALRHPLRVVQRAFTRRRDDRFWALKDVTFELKRGEVLGIIGRNGAGKSTLLKILSRITDPSAGRAVVQGRLASLLEVGTGFHPELTGRENIYLNGTILGMRRREIDRKLDEIVAFSEVERFLDTPVKHYSSGMYVRLAFAVAAHLDPEVLVVDEVLAVGDRQFQNKCLGRIESMARGEGRTVLLVTHSLDTIQRICDRAVILRGGLLDFDGRVPDAIDRYIKDGRESSERGGLAARTDRYGSGTVIATTFEVKDDAGSSQSTLMSGRNYRFCVGLRRPEADAQTAKIQVAIEIRDTRDITVWLVYSAFTNHDLQLSAGEIIVEARVRDLNLAAGDYSVTLFIAKGEKEVLDCIHNAASITVAGGDFFGTGSSGMPDQCKTLTRAEWTVT